MIKVLGASGSLDKDKSCISFQLNPSTVIDAGNIMRALGEDSNAIQQVFLTHAHFDHIVDLPFLIETHFEKRKLPLKIYALPETLQVLEQHIFNDVVWPSFQNIQHPTIKQPLLTFIEIEIGQEIQVENTTVIPIEAEHTAGSCGYIVKENGISCLISGDTFLNSKMVERINTDASIHSLVIDTSFPSYMDNLAEQSKHLTPKLLKQLLAEIQRPIKVYPYHLKPAYEQEIIDELKQPGLEDQVERVLNSGDELNVFGKTIELSSPNQPTHLATSEQLQSLLTTAQALSSETDLNRLLEMILEQAMAFSRADAGTLYRFSPKHNELEFTVVKNNSLNIHMGGTTNDPITWPNLPLYLEDGQANEQMVATYCGLSKRIINIDNVYEDENFNYEGTKAFDAKTGYQSKAMLVVPLLNCKQELLGVLQLINKTDTSGNLIPFREPDQQNTSALASQAAISLTNALLIQELEELFESILATITKAFDEKCSFTGGHVRLVAELTRIIAEGIDQDQTIYKDVSYSNDDFHTLRIAALLHDVGKIATPEFIMQKSTKLEKVHDRIELIGERIEILKRDAQIDYLEKINQQNGNRENNEFKEALQQRIQELESLYQFLKTSNTGAKFLQDEELELIQQWSEASYQVNGEEHPLINEDEKVNLSIRAGTLNHDERNKIMDHARVSLEILTTLPFPKKYQRVVDIAANHHEKLDGSGYPRGLKDEQLTLEDKILILADLYEALSSKDRPYKDPNKLSQIFNILGDMANKGLIDKTLLKFFHESGTYQVFNQYLQPDQLDEINLTLAN